MSQFLKKDTRVCPCMCVYACLTGFTSLKNCATKASMNRECMGTSVLAPRASTTALITITTLLCFTQSLAPLLILFRPLSVPINPSIRDITDGVSVVLVNGLTTGSPGLRRSHDLQSLPIIRVWILPPWLISRYQNDVPKCWALKGHAAW